MITETNPIDPPVEGGRIINTYRYRLRAFRLNKLLEGVSQMCFALIECKSNNTSNSVSAPDARNFQRAVAAMDREWNWAKAHRNDPTGTHELVFTLQFPRPDEIQAMFNTKLKSVAWEVYNFFHVGLGSQDANQQIWIGADTEDDIDTALATLTEVVETMLGTGEETNGVFDVGASMPDYQFLGTIKPPIASPEVAVQEPSSDVAPPRVPDAADKPSVTGGATA
jgi:hypothetical protein